VEIYGADAARLFVLFAAPIENELVWNESGIEGAVRFLQRLWRLVHKWSDVLSASPTLVKDTVDQSVPPAVAGGEVSNADNSQRDTTTGGNATAGERASTPSSHTATETEDDHAEFHTSDTPAARKLRQKTHQTIKRITDSFEAMQFNTPVAALMELTNAIYESKFEPETANRREKLVVRESITAVTLMLAPFAPHTAEELYSVLIGNDRGMIANGARFPEYSEELAQADEIEIAVQVNGKLRSRITASPDASNVELEAAATRDPKVLDHLDGKQIVKVIVVPGRLVNVVVK